MKLPITFKYEVLHLSVCTLLHVIFSLNTSVTCAFLRLICHNIFLLPNCDVLQAECSLPSVKSAKDERENKEKRGGRR